ncbi:hypothetical protein TrLO_g4925 [Triparma laevis f. longispina]|uniref:Uncharacterized protein n=1 Tax=Triparma laevis f. longispina TaxID=1714387 RepID=A0A9W7C3V6_9STRA|nr:hypothetical protein TrLO_g4925 [Triparma laevis f. longispina]
MATIVLEFACLALKDIMVLVLCITLCMMLLAVGVEELFVHLNRVSKTSHFWSSVLHAVEKELLVLGVISFLLFMFEQIFVGDGSHTLEELAELIEFVHLLLFFAFIVYYVFVSGVGYVCVRHLRRLKEFEEGEVLGHEYSREIEIGLLRKSVEEGGYFYWQRLHWEYYHFYRMKNIFLVSNASRPHPSIDMTFSNFRYSDYLESSTTHLFVKMIHVGWRIWATGIVVVGVFTGVFAILMYSHKPDSINLENQLDRMWLDGDATPPQRAVDNVFVINMMNIAAFILLIVSRAIYMTTNSETFLAKLEALSKQKPAISDMNDVSSDANTPMLESFPPHRRPDKPFKFDPFRRCSEPRPHEDPWTTVWFMKAPDLMIRVYQINILYFSFYASLFILTLRFANDWAWVFFVIYPVLVLFGMGYRLLPHYASLRFCGNLTLDSAVGSFGRGGTQSFDESH